MRRYRNITTKNRAGIYIAFAAVSALFLIIQRLTHIEFMLHLAAIPLEVLLAVFIVERYFKNRERNERQIKLMLIKSYYFRAYMRDLFITNFDALKFPSLTMAKIKSANLDELRKMREDANTIEYKSLEAMEPAIIEYVKAQYVWRNFMDLAITYNFNEVFHDMINILHFILRWSPKTGQVVKVGFCS